MNKITQGNKYFLNNDSRFVKGLSLFNSGEWYLAHDYFEDLWHETIGPERRTLQGILQIAVAQIHLERNNLNGAVILYGEGLGRLREINTPDLGLDIDKLCEIVENRLLLLQKRSLPDKCDLPYLFKKKDKT